MRGFSDPEPMMSSHWEQQSTGSAMLNTRLRDGSNPIERKAVYRAQVEIASMPASIVVQIALWPDRLADWAKDTGVAPSVVYNMLAGVKPYHRVRTLLARRLGVPKLHLDALIDASRPEPRAKLPPDPPDPPPAPPDRVPVPRAQRSSRASAELAPDEAADALPRGWRRSKRSGWGAPSSAGVGSEPQISLNI